MNPVLLQKQVRDNAEDLNSYLLDLKCWETEMKRKEEALGAERTAQKTTEEKEKKLPPVRSKRKKTLDKKKKDNDTESKTAKKKISGFDYASWDRFDVDEACAAVDGGVEESEEEETESEEEGEIEETLREEAIYEKEKGNQFVKNKKWKEAITCYTRAIECFAYDTIYYANRALCYLKLEEFQLAEQDCTSSIQLDITYVKAYQRRAAARVGLGLLLEAKSDLETVLKLEAMNTSSKAELVRVEKLIAASESPKVAGSVAGTVVPQAEKPDRGSGEPGVTEGTGWGTTEDGVRLVQAIYKPPHLRSKKPLQRIEIQEIGDIANVGTAPTLPSAASSSSHSNIVEMESATAPVSPKVNVVPTGAVEENTVAESEELPPRPISSVEFLHGWKRVNASPNLKFLYLKQIPGAELPNIFQESLDSATLTDVISTLATDFLQHNEPVSEYLSGLSNVKRLSALTLFMSSGDQEGVKKLLNSCVANGECTEEEATKLRDKFEL